MKQKKGRHAPAFILLVLKLKPTHGLGILNKMNELVENNRLDTAVIYRNLKAMEEKGLISSQWQESEAGPQKKVYHITKAGEETLAEFKLDIEMSLSNLMTFIKVYNSLK